MTRGFCRGGYRAARPARFGLAGSRGRDRIRSGAETAVLSGLLLTIVVSAVVGAQALLFGAVAGAWAALCASVGVRNVLDAGCAFMLVVVGVILVADLAVTGSAYPPP